MIELQKAKLRDFLPPNLKNDAEIKALCAAWDERFDKLIHTVLISTMVWAFVQELYVNMADHLCLSLDIKGYKADLSLDQKRKLIHSALLNYSRLGTKSSVENAVSIIHGGTTIEENWQYDGEPYHFRVKIDARQKQTSADPMNQILDTIKSYKNLRSWLDDIEVDLSAQSNLHAAAFGQTILKGTISQRSVIGADFSCGVKVVPLSSVGICCNIKERKDKK